MSLVIKDTRWNDNAANSAAAEGARRGQERAARNLLGPLATVAPLDSGRLIGSAFVEAGDDEAIIGYDSHYAAILHEHPEFNFQRGREGKWLERTLNSQQDAVFNDLGDAMRESLG